MTLTEFLKNYKMQFETTVISNTLLAITKVIRRSDGKVVDGVKTFHDIFDTNHWIEVSKSPHSINEWNWDDIIEETKRAQLDYFAQRIPIEDFFPMNSSTDITPLYI